MIRYKFSKHTGQEFAITLKERVNAYFQDEQLSKNANGHMIIKSIAALSLYFIPYAFIVLGGFGNIPLLFTLWILMGLGKAFVGTSVMHDALHGSYSKNKTINFLMGISPNVLGIDGKLWKIQHNVLHHSYTNIEHADEDIQPRFVMRFSPHQPRRWFHRYQYIYAMFFYGISTLLWVTFKDYYKMADYRKKGLIKAGKPFRQHLTSMIIRKLLYYFFALVLPILVLPIPAWLTLLMFITMHMVTGVALSLVFQLAHVMPTTSFIDQEDDDKIRENWFVHQLNTTTNFAMQNKVLSFFTGGLNYQVEHHLFPNICHVHYPKISRIVQQTTSEFSLPYHAQKSFGSALNSHFRMLKQLGRA